MDATETCLKAVNTKLTDMIDYCTQAATGTYNEKDRADIVTQLKQFSNISMSRMPMRIMPDVICLRDFVPMCRCF